MRIFLIALLFGCLLHSIAYGAAGANWTKAGTPTWEARAWSTSVVFNNKLWVMGGLGTVGYNDVWSSNNGENWTKVAPTSPIWSKRYGHTSVVFNNKMWVMGGKGGGGSSYKDVWSSSDGANWTLEASAPGWSIRSEHSSVVFNNKMWVMGGYYNPGMSPDFHRDVWSSSNGKKWDKITASAPWLGKFQHAAMVFDNKMWVMGGSGSGGPTNEVWSSSNGATWISATAAPPKWAKRRAHTAEVFGNRLWVMGGWSASATPFQDVWYSLSDIWNP